MQRFVVDISDELVPQFLAHIEAYGSVKIPQKRVPRPWRCLECSSTFETAQKLMRHEDKVHSTVE